MNVFELVGKIALAGAADVKKDLGDIDSSAEGTASKFDGLQKTLTAAATAVSAISGAALALIESNKETNTSLSITGVTLGKSREEMQELATQTSDQGFKLGEVADTFDVLTKAGVRNTDELQNSAKAFDSLADATGGEAAALASTLIPGFKALGETIPQTSGEMDNLTWLANNTSVGLEDFGSVMSYVAKDGQNLNLTSADIVKALAALEAKGITGTAATMKFRTAVKEAAEGNGSLNEALGLTNEEVAVFDEALQNAQGSTDTYSNAAEGNLTMMDKLKSAFEDASLKVAAYLEPMQPLLTVMTALAPALYAVAGAQKVLNLAMTGNPIGLIIVGLAAGVAAVIAFHKYWEKIPDWLKPVLAILGGGFTMIYYLVRGGIEVFQEVWRKLQEFWEKAKAIVGPAVEAIKGALETAWNAIKSVTETVWNAIAGFFQTVWNAIYSVVEPVLNAIKTLIEAYWNAMKTTAETVWNAIKVVIEGVWEAIKLVVAVAAAIVYAVIKAIWDQIGPYVMAVWNAVKAAIEAAWNAITTVITAAINAVKTAMDTAWNAIKSAATTVWNAIKAIFSPVWEAIKGVFTTALNAINGAMDTAWTAIKGNLTTAWNAIKGGFQTAWDGIKGVFSSAWEGIKGIWNSVGSYFDSVVSTISSKFNGVIDAIAGPFRTAFNAIKGIANAIIGGLNQISFDVPDFPGVPHRGEHIGISIPYLAKGGLILEPSLIYGLQSQRFIAGMAEKGPETVVPGLPSAAAAQTVNVIVELDGKVLAQALALPLVNEVRLKTGVRI